MRLFGSNARFGTEKIALTQGRYTLPIEVDAPAFPLGIGGLIPVVTIRMDDSERRVYAFWSESNNLEVSPANSDLKVVVLNNLSKAVDTVNTIIAEAEQRSHHELARIESLVMGIPQDGWHFTRVEYRTMDAHNLPSRTPVHLYLFNGVKTEGADKPAQYPYIETRIDYDAQGVPQNMVLTIQLEELYSNRINAHIDQTTDQLAVHTVEEYFGADQNHHAHLIYKRGTDAVRQSNVFRRYPSDVLTPRDIKKAEAEAQREAIENEKANDEAANVTTSDSSAAESIVTDIPGEAEHTRRPQEEIHLDYRKLHGGPAHTEARYDDNANAHERDLRPGRYHGKSDYRYRGRNKKGR